MSTVILNYLFEIFASLFSDYVSDVNVTHSQGKFERTDRVG